MTTLQEHKAQEFHKLQTNCTNRTFHAHKTDVAAMMQLKRVDKVMMQ